MYEADVAMTIQSKLFIFDQYVVWYLKLNYQTLIIKFTNSKNKIKFNTNSRY